MGKRANNFPFLLLLVFLFIYQGNVSSQNTDSLWIIWSDEDQVDTFRFDAFHNLIRSKWLYWNEDSLLSHTDMLHDFARNSKKDLFIATSYYVKGDANLRQGNTLEALDNYARSQELFNTLDFPYKKAMINYNIGGVYFLRSDFIKAIEYYKYGLADAEKIGDQKLIAYYYLYVGLVLVAQGDYEEARNYNEKSLNIFIELDDQMYIATLENNIASTYGYQGQYEKAIKLLLNNVEVFEQSNDIVNLTALLNEIGIIYSKQGNYQKAFDYLNRSLEMTKMTGVKFNIARINLMIGDIFHEKGNYAAALMNYEKSLKTYQDIDLTDGIADCLSKIGRLYYSLENFEQSLDYYNQSLAFFEELKLKGKIADVNEQIGQVIRKNGNIESSVDHFYKSMEINLKLGRQNALSDNYKELGVSFKDLDDHVTALEYFQKSKEITERIGDRQGMAEVYLEIGYLELKENKVSSAEDWCEKSYKLVQAIGTLKLEKEACECLYLVNKKLGNGDLALAYYERSYRLEDSLKTDEASKQLQQMEFDRLRTEDSLARVEDKLKSELAFQDKLSREKNTRNTFMFGGLAILLIAGGLFSRMLYIRRTNKQLEKKNEIIAREKERAEESERAKEQFFDNVSHEFRTPLTLILGPLDEAIQSTTDQNVKPNLEIMQRNATRLAGMINELLDLSKLEFGKVKLQAKEENIVKLTEGFLQSFESLADQKKIKLSFKSRAKEYLVWIDADQIRKILANLLSNAFKFTSEGGEVKLSIVSIANPRDLMKTDHIHTSGIILKISDTGIGIPEEKLPNIFDRFYQVGDSTQTHHTGTGIGLALTRELVELHHGTINVSSKPGKGTTFSIFIPFGKEHISDDEMVEEALTEVEMLEKESALESETEDSIETGEAVPEAEMRVDHEDLVILIAEDNPDMRTYIRSQLEKNYAILEAKDGEEGLQRAFEAIPDLIISDVMMPVMDGREMTERLKTDQRTSHIPVIILTARAAIESKIEGLETGADAYITKPFNAKELQVRVRKLIEQRQKLRERYSRKLDQRIEIEVDQSLVSMEERFLQKAMEIVNENISETDFDSQAFASEMALSRVQLHRKIKALTNKTTSEFIRTIRLNKAAELLKQQSDNVTQIAYETGFSSLSWFAKVFKEKFGVSPSEYS